MAIMAKRWPQAAPVGALLACSVMCFLLHAHGSANMHFRAWLLHWAVCPVLTLPTSAMQSWAPPSVLTHPVCTPATARGRLVVGAERRVVLHSDAWSAVCGNAKCARVSTAGRRSHYAERTATADAQGESAGVCDATMLSTMCAIRSCAQQQRRGRLPLLMAAPSHGCPSHGASTARPAPATWSAVSFSARASSAYVARCAGALALFLAVVFGSWVVVLEPLIE